VALAALAAFAVVAAMGLWPAHDPDEIEHIHDGLDKTDPHLAGAVRLGGGYRHRHTFVIDSHHPEWPQSV
jgi:hypothetical protein